MNKAIIFCGLILLLVTNITKSQSPADSGYYYLNKGNKTLAAKFFEEYIKENPSDTKVRMQLGYMYYDDQKYSNALQNFRFVGNHSTDQKDVEASKSAESIIKEEMSLYSAKSVDLYFYNFYDSYQENYIANFIGHYNFRIAPMFYTGFYANIYTDSRSRPDLIYNDRYLELGGFLRYNFFKNLFFEFRLGYAREVDLDKSSMNVEPLLVYFNRIGDARVYVSSPGADKTDWYFDMYYAGLYDYKFQNVFGQIALNEVLRFHTGGYSYIETYLDQNLSADSRRVNYNNYGEIGTGVRYHANIPFFPVIFIEPAYRGYFLGGIKNSFTIKGGFQFIFRTPL